MKVFFVITFASVVVLGAKLPSGVPLCHKSDPNFEKCLTEAANKAINLLLNGYKPLGIPKLNPLFIKQMHLNGGLQQNYDNMNVYGYDRIAFTKFKFHVKECIMEFDTIVPENRLEADYALKGQVLIFPVNGHGKCNVTLINLVGQNKVECERTVKNGKTYLHVTKWTLKLIPEKIHYDFENLIPGNPELSKPLLKTVNDNSLDIFNEVRPAYEESYAYINSALASKFFDKIPENEIFLD